MEIIISNKNLLKLAEINNAQIVRGFSYNGTSQYKFISLNKDQLAKNILYVDHDNNYILEQRR